MKVSVAIITFNQESFISEAIESVLSQVVNFDYEIVISDDRSDDNTKKILLEYQRRKPELIRLILNNKNKGMNKNFIDTVCACKGDYIAYLEGDDYWLSPFKLQKQVDMLDKNKEYKFCFSLVKKIYQDIDKTDEIIPDYVKRRDSTLEDFLISNFIGTSSLMFRNEKIKWPSWILNFKMMDWPLYVLLLEKGGKAGYIDAILSAYRIHNRGVHTQNSEVKNLKNAIIVLNVFNKYLNFKYKKIIYFAILRFNYHLVKEYYAKKDFFNVIIFTLKMIKFWLLNYEKWFGFKHKPLKYYE